MGKMLRVHRECTQKFTYEADWWGPVDCPVSSQLGPLTGQRGQWDPHVSG